MIKTISRGRIKFNVRKDTLDEWVVDEVLQSYQKALEIRPGDVVLDIGMNIGAFTVWAAFLGGKLIGLEPDPDNFAVAESNMKINGLAGTLINKGASDCDGVESLYLNEKKNRGQHSIYFVNGRREIRIECIAMNKLLETYRPNKLKIDCEGAEYKIVRSVTNWDGIDRIMMEFHRKILHDESNEKFNEVLSILEKNYDVVCKRDGKGWVQIVKAMRRKP